MSIKILARTWDAFGKRDPLWAVLTDRRLSLEEFFQSGEDEVQAALDHAERLGITVNRDRALDFGCGLGRLTQAMARRFRACDGVDIASSMIEAANRHNRYPDTCRYHLNSAGDLGLFPGRPFTFVYSTLVLQHMEPAHAKAYVREFIRVLAPGGLLVFQIPSHRGPDEPPAGAPRTLCSGPLPRTAFQADVQTTESDVTVQAGQLMTVPVVVRNLSDTLWPSLGRSDFRYQVQVANRWLHPDGSAFGLEGARCPLPYDLAPGAEARVLLGVAAPDVNGVYSLELDVVQEDVAWFGERGASTARVQVNVEGGRPADPATARRRVSPQLPLRKRYPRLYGIFRATGSRAVYLAYRYLIMAARREREVWRRAHDTTMEMHCIPKAEVAALVSECGATLVEAEKHDMDGGFQSRRYWVVRHS